MSHGECDLDHLLRLSTDPLNIEGTLHTEPMESVKGLNTDAFQAFLEGNGVRAQYIDSECLTLLYEEVIEAPLECHSMVVAKGTHAINGNNGSYELTDEISEQFEAVNARKESIKNDSPEQSEPPPPEDNEDSSDEAVNYYDQMAFVIVQKGDIVATKTERSEGIDGCDIYGQTIPANEGKSSEKQLDASIKLNPDGTCTAMVAGELKVLPNGFSVSTELEIKDDVDFETGRIVFPGSVTVGGSVRDQFHVKAQGDIQVRGLVEASILESTGTITLARGMAGKDTGTIKAGLDLDAGYLESSIAQVGRNAIVKREITNCTMEIDGQLLAEHAALRGGAIRANNGATVGSIGSIQGVETEVVIGSLPAVEEQIRAIDGFFDKLDSEIASQKSNLEAYASAIAKPTAGQIEEQMGMQFEIDELGQRQEQLNTAKRDLHSILTKNTTTKLHVQKAIYPKVVLFIPGSRVEFPTELMGESIIELGQTGHPSITYRGQTSALSDHAKVIPDERILRVVQNEDTPSVAA